MKRVQLLALAASLAICAANASDAVKGSQTEVLGYSLGASTCDEIRRNLASSHPELIEGKMSDIPQKYKALTSNSTGFGVVGLKQVSMLCEDSLKSTLRGASLLFEKSATQSILDIFDKKYTKLQKEGESILYKTPGGVLIANSTPTGLKAIYTDMTLFQDLSDMANGMSSKL